MSRSSRNKSGGRRKELENTYVASSSAVTPVFLGLIVLRRLCIPRDIDFLLSSSQESLIHLRVVRTIGIR